MSDGNDADIDADDGDDRDDDREELAHEAADIVYHLLVLLSMKGMDLGDLREELRARR